MRARSSSPFSAYTGVAEILRAYFRVYGGFSAVYRSPYLHAALMLVLPTYGIWSVAGWWDLPLNILPNLISFTLAGYALFMGFGDDKFRKLMAGTKEDSAPMLAISATFTHFIIIQVLAVVMALVAKGRPFGSLFHAMNVHSQQLDAFRYVAGNLFWATSFAVFLYAICSIVATTLSVFRVTRWFNQSHTNSARE